MAARLTALLVTGALGLAVTPVADAASTGSKPPPAPASKVLIVQQGTSLAQVLSLSSVPMGFHASAGQAVKAAEHTRTMQMLHRRLHPLQVTPFVWRSQHPYWYVIFEHHNRIVATADVSTTGVVRGVWTGVQAMATFAHGGWSWSVTSWWVLLPGSLLFLLPFFDPRRLWRMAHLDALAVLAFLISWLTLAQAHLESAVWLAYPPLIYLLVRLR